MNSPHARPVLRSRSRPLRALILTGALLIPAPAEAQGLETVTNLLSGASGLLSSVSGGSVVSLLSMIPGLNFLAGVGPVMDLINTIPGLSNLISQVPGLSQLFSLLGGSVSNLGPLSEQIASVSRWVNSARDIAQTARGLLRPANLNDFATSANAVLRAAGVNKQLSGTDYKDPQAAARAAIGALDEQQRVILNELAQAKTPTEALATQEKAAVIGNMKSRLQRNADNAEAQINSEKLTDQALTRAQDSIGYTSGAAKALKDNKKTEDILKIVGSASLENLKVSALNSAAITSALANQMKVQVATAEMIGQLVEGLERDRIAQANDVAREMQLRQKQALRKAEIAEEQSKALFESLRRSTSGESLRGVDLLGGAP